MSSNGDENNWNSGSKRLSPNGRKKKTSGRSQSSSSDDQSQSSSTDGSKAGSQSSSTDGSKADRQSSSNDGSTADSQSSSTDGSTADSQSASTDDSKADSQSASTDGHNQTAASSEALNSVSNMPSTSGASNLRRNVIVTRKRSRSEGCSYGSGISFGSLGSFFNDNGCTTPIKKPATPMKKVPEKEQEQLDESDSSKKKDEPESSKKKDKPDSTKKKNEHDSSKKEEPGRRKIKQEPGSKAKGQNMVHVSCSSFAKDVQYLGDRFCRAMAPVTAHDEFVSVLDMNTQRARFVFQSGQEIQANVAEFNRIFMRLHGAPDLVIRLDGRGPYFNMVQYWNGFMRTVRSLTVEGDAHESDIHFVLGRSFQLQYLQLLRITVAGRIRGNQPTSIYGDLAYHLPQNLAGVTVDCRGFGNGGFLHVMKHTSGRMYASDRHVLDHATFVVADFPRARALDQYVNDIHLWVYSSLTVLVSRPPDDNYVQVLDQRQFYLIGRIDFAETGDSFVVYRCTVGEIHLQIGFILPRV